MHASLTNEEFQLLRSINTPTIANALELLGIRHRLEGFTRGLIKSIFPEKGAALGFAVTVKIRSAARPQNSIGLKPYWDHIASIPAPRMVVVQDLDQPAAGAWWGEVNANIHRALGCIGLVTDGTVRDLDEVRALGFYFFAAGLAVSHGYACPVEFNTPVVVDGMAVNPGDLIHADQHGAIAIPPAEARKLFSAVGAVERYERPIIQHCKSPEFSTSRLEGLLSSKVI